MARQRHDWQQTSAILAMLYNANRGERSSPAKPEDFDPMARRAPRKTTRRKMGVEVLDAFFARYRKG